MISGDYELIVPGEASSLAMIRSVVTHLAYAAGLPDHESDRIELAVDEACSNVIDHAYRNRDPKPRLHIVIHNSHSEFRVDIIDEGSSFDYKGYVEPEFPNHWIDGNMRGAGLYLIHRCVDEVTYDQLSNARNRMRLIKKLEPVSSTA